MFQLDLIFSFTIMALLFIRQIMILKLPNKISYTPIMLGVGVISSLIHFIINSQAPDTILLMRESLFPILFALLLFIVMNVMQQNQESENAKYKEEFSEVIVEQINELKSFVTALETRMLQYSQEDRTLQENMREQFKSDIKVLDKIQANQMKFLNKFDEVEAWHKSVSNEFENFIEVQVPELDKIVHKHIDILRVSEQDHYNRLKLAIETSLDGGIDISEDMEELKERIKSFENLSSTIAKSIVKESTSQLSEITKSYKGDMITLKSHAEGLKTLLFEGENKLTTMKIQSNEIFEKIHSSLQDAEELQEQNSELYKLNHAFKELMKDVEAVKVDYLKSQAKLTIVVDELKNSKYESIKSIEKKVEKLQEELVFTLEQSLDRLQENYKTTHEDITHNVQLLSQQAKLQKEYASSLDTKEPVSNTIDTF